MAEPKRYIDLLEFIYICFSLGFRGRYKVETQNSGEFELIYKKLHDAILNVRNYNTSNIVIYQEHDANKHFYKLLNKKSLKKIFFMGFIVLAFIYFIYSFVLGRQSQSILDQLNSLLG